MMQTHYHTANVIILTTFYILEYHCLRLYLHELCIYIKPVHLHRSLHFFPNRYVNSLLIQLSSYQIINITI